MYAVGLGVGLDVGDDLGDLDSPFFLASLATVGDGVPLSELRFPTGSKPEPVQALLVTSSPTNIEENDFFRLVRCPEVVDDTP